MWYLIGEILVFMLITAVLWGAIGWWLRSLGHRSQFRRAENDWSAQLQSLRRARDGYREQLEQSPVVDPAAPGQVLTDSQRAKLAGHIKRLQDEVAAGQEQLAAMDKKLSRFGEDAQLREQQEDQLRERLAAAVKTVHERDERIRALQAETGDGSEQTRQLHSYEQTVTRLKQRIEELSDSPQAEKERVEHGKLLSVIQAQKQTIASLNEKIHAAADDADGSELDDELARRDTAIRHLTGEADQYREENVRLTAQLRSVREHAGKQDAELARLNQALEERENTKQTEQRRVADMERQLEVAAQGQQGSDREMELMMLTANQKQRIEELEDRLAASYDTDPQPRIEELEMRLAAAVANAEPSDDMEAELKRVNEAMVQQERLIADLRERLQAESGSRRRTVARRKPHSDGEALSGDLFGKRPAFILTSPEGSPDDLRRIRGIGPVLASRLNGIGIFHYRQIAALTGDDIAWVASQLDSFPSRILRDRWVAQAAELEHARRQQD